MRAVRAVRTRRQLMRATRGRTLKSCRLVCLSLAALALATAGWAQEPFRLFPVSKGGKSGYITRDGRVRIAPRFDSAAEFHEGRARVTLGGRPTFVNTSGEVVFTPQFDSVGDFSEGLAFVQLGWKTNPSIGVTIEMGKWGYIDRTGRVAVPPQFDDAGDFSEGLAAVRLRVDESHYVTCPLQDPGSTSTGTKLYGYIARAGRLLIPPQFEYAKPFSEGLAEVSNCSKPSFIDKTGAVVLRVTFDEAMSFKGGLAPVMFYRLDGALTGYIDKTGKVVWEPSR